MALHFLSGDAEMNGKKNKSKKADKKAAKANKKATKKANKGTKPKKVAKVALVPARAAFMAVI